MSLIYVLVPVGLILAGLSVAAFVWCVRTGQLDDMDTPPLRMLNDDVASGSGGKKRRRG